MPSGPMTVDEFYGASEPPPSEQKTSLKFGDPVSPDEFYSARPEKPEERKSPSMGPLVMPDAKARERLNSLADRVVEAGDLDRGYWSDSASTMIDKKFYPYFLKTVYEKAEKSPLHKGKGVLSRAAHAAVRGTIGVKESLDDLAHEMLVGEKRDRDQIEFGNAIRQLREQADPLNPEDAPFYKRWAISAAEMAPPMLIGQGLAAPLRVAQGALATEELAGQGLAKRALSNVMSKPGAANTAFWATQIYPDEIQQQRESGVADSIGVPLALVSSVLQGAAESMNIDAVIPKGAIKAMARHGLLESAKQYGTELSEEMIQAAVSEATLQLSTRLDKDAPNRKLGESFRNVVSQTVQSAGPLMVMMAPGQGLAMARRRWSKADLLTEQGAAQFVKEDPASAEKITEAESPSRAIVEDLIEKERIEKERWNEEERKKAADLLRQAQAKQAAEEKAKQEEAEAEAKRQAEQAAAPTPAPTEPERPAEEPEVAPSPSPAPEPEAQTPQSSGELAPRTVPEAPVGPETPPAAQEPQKTPEPPQLSASQEEQPISSAGPNDEPEPKPVETVKEETEEVRQPPDPRRPEIDTSYQRSTPGRDSPERKAIYDEANKNLEILKPLEEKYEDLDGQYRKTPYRFNKKRAKLQKQMNALLDEIRPYRKIDQDLSEKLGTAIREDDIESAPTYEHRLAEMGRLRQPGVDSQRYWGELQQIARQRAQEIAPDIASDPDWRDKAANVAVDKFSISGGRYKVFDDAVREAAYETRMWRSQDMRDEMKTFSSLPEEDNKRLTAELNQVINEATPGWKKKAEAILEQARQEDAVANEAWKQKRAVEESERTKAAMNAAKQNMKERRDRAKSLSQDPIILKRVKSMGSEKKKAATTQKVSLLLRDKEGKEEVTGEVYGTWAVHRIDKKTVHVNDTAHGGSLPFATEADAWAFVALSEHLGIPSFDANDPEKTLRQKKIFQYITGGDSNSLEEKDRAKLIDDFAQVAETTVKADIVLDAGTLGMGLPDSFGGAEAGITLVKHLSKEVPEFAYNPIFRVNDDNNLVFKDGYTFVIYPHQLNLDPAELDPGMTVGINLEDLGIKRPDEITVVTSVLDSLGYDVKKQAKKKTLTAQYRPPGKVALWDMEERGEKYVVPAPVTITGEGHDWTVTSTDEKQAARVRNAVDKIRWETPVSTKEANKAEVTSPDAPVDINKEEPPVEPVAETVPVPPTEEPAAQEPTVEAPTQEEKKPKKPIKIADQIVATSTANDGKEYEIRVVPTNRWDGKRGYRLEIREKGTAKWEGAMAGHHGTVNAAKKSILRVNDFGTIQSDDPIISKVLETKQKAVEKEQQEKARQQEEERLERLREFEFRERMAREAKATKWTRETFEALGTGEEKRTVKGYTSGFWGVHKSEAKKPRDGEQWIVVHLPTGLQAGTSYGLDDAKALVNAFSHLGNWNWTNEKKADPGLITKAGVTLKAWKQNVAPNYKDVPELAPKEDVDTEEDTGTIRQEMRASSGFADNYDTGDAEVKTGPEEQPAPQEEEVDDEEEPEEEPDPEEEPPKSESERIARQVKGLPMPELVRLARAIQGHPPIIRAIQKALGYFEADKQTGATNIFIRPDLATDPQVLAQVLAHELGHLIDFLPHRTVKRGNILGRIASLKSYTKKFLAGYPGGKGPLTENEKRRLRRIAERLNRVGAEIEIDEVIRTETPITPQDILNIWNNIEGSISPELLDYVKKLDRAGKKSIVSEALKGTVPDQLKRFAKVVETKTGKKIKQTLPPDAAAIQESYRQLIEEEIQKRQLLDVEEITNELIAVSAWWTPYNPSDDPGGMYRRYREKPEELYAQALSVLLVAPNELKNRAPKFWRAFWNYADRKPEVLKTYLDIQDALYGIPEKLQELRRGSVIEGFSGGEEAARARLAELKERKMNLVTEIGAGLLDSSMPVLHDVKQKRGSAQAKAARYALNELTQKNSVARLWLESAQEQVVKPITDAGMTLDDAGEYLAYRRMMTERKDIANPYGHTEETATQAMEHLRERVGQENFDLLTDRIKEYDDLIFDVVEQAAAWGVYNLGLFHSTLKHRRGKYATFAVVDHIVAQMPAGIRRQVGTFSDIGNPFSFTAAKMVSLHRAIEINKAKMAVRDFYNTDFKGALKRNTVGRNEQPPKPAHGNDHLVVMENGRPVFYECEEYIAGVFDHQDIAYLGRVAQMIGSAQYKLFHPLYVKFSPGWQIFNLPRDFLRTHKNLEAGRARWESIATSAVKDLLIRLPKHYAKALGPSWRRAGGKSDPVIRNMERAKAIDIALASHKFADDSTVMERLLQSHGIMTDEQKKESGKLRNALGAVFNFVERVGITTETISKVAAWNLMEENGIDERERSYIVRNLVGTPNYHIKGRNTHVTNSLFIYSNVILQGIRADASVATDPKTAAGYWLRSMLTNYLPKTVMIAAAYGLFGKAVEAMFDMIPDYDKSKYLVLPFGTVNDPDTGESRVKYIRIPHDDVSRVICALMWETSKAKDLSVTRMVSEIWGEVPSASPGLAIAWNWGQWAVGMNPKDWFRDRDIISRDAFAAGRKYSSVDMLRWTANQGGVLSVMSHAVIGDPGKLATETVKQKVVASVPGLDRVFKTSNRGLYEDAWADLEMEDAERARLRLNLDDLTRSFVKERYRLNRMGPERLNEQDAERRAMLNLFYKANYVELTEVIEYADNHKDEKLAKRARGELAKRAEKLQTFIRENPARAKEIATDLRVVGAVEMLMKSRPIKRTDQDAWMEDQKTGQELLDRINISDVQIRDIWRKRNLEQLKTDRGRQESMEKLNRVLTRRTRKASPG